MKRIPKDWTSIELVIEAFKLVLDHYEKEVTKIPIEEFGFICLTSDNFGLNLRPIFNSHTGYYQNYMHYNTLICKYSSKTKEYLQFKIRFLEKEIISLKKLVKEGYTHI